MNDEIKEKIKAYYVANDINEVLDYITNLQQAIKDTKDTADDMLYELKQENERKERLITQYGEGMCAYANRVEKAIEYINENKHLSMFADCREPEEDWNYDLECSANDLLNILQNGSEKNGKR